MAWDRAGCEMWDTTAALVIPPSSTTATNSSSRRRSICIAYVKKKKSVLDFWVWRVDRGGVTEVLVLVAGLGVGLVFGMFGAGGSAFATPVLALIGVPPVIAVASPLPAMIPASFAGARHYLRTGNLDSRVARLAIAGGVPGTLVGALASSVVSGQYLLVLSGVMLLAVGARVLMPDTVSGASAAVQRLQNRNVILGSAFAVGLLTGLLANGGGFLLVPLFVVLLGMTTARAAGTSMVAVGALDDSNAGSTSRARTHRLGHRAGLRRRTRARIDRERTPRARVPAAAARRSFGILLVVFASWFLVHLAF